MKKTASVFLIALFVVGLVPFNGALAITPNQINAEVQIVCPDSYGNWFSGSGTIIDPKGIILTNKHVVTDQYGSIIPACFIGFVESISKEPNFGTEQNPNFAEVKFYTNTKDKDAAILYLNNPSKKIFPSVNIWGSDSNSLQFGQKIEAIGFPSIGGSTITYTSGDFSGFGSVLDGTQNYIKATTPLEHGNSGGAAYNSTGQFIGIPTMVVSGTLNSLSYILSVNSIKIWLSSLLGVQYKNEVIQTQPIVTPPEVSVQTQQDITPPYQKEFFIGFTAYNENGDWVYYGNRYGDSKAAIYEFPKIRFQLRDFIDNNGTVKGYYYYFGTDPRAIPRDAGKYILATNLICDQYCNLVPEMFSVSAGESNYFIVQAVDDAGNISNPLINFQYIYEKDNFKDIKSFDIKSSLGKIIGTLKYPTLEESPGCQAFQFCRENRILDYTENSIYTNQDSLFFYPNYGYEIDGLTYYISYGDDRWWADKERIGKSTSDKFVKITNIRSKGTTNLFLKPYKNNVNSFFGKHLILQIIYKSSANVITPENSGIASSAVLKFTENNTVNDNAPTINNSLVGRILLQVESHGEAWYVNPSDGKRYYMKDGAAAYSMMRSFSLGITDENLNKIPSVADTTEMKNSTSICAQNVLANKLKGKILLQTEQNGEAWYVEPTKCRAIYMKDGSVAYEIMRFLGLGITNADLEKITAGSL